jgi:hypothetical protein
LQEAETEALEAREHAAHVIHDAEPGLYLEFEGPPGVDLKLESLEKSSGFSLHVFSNTQRRLPAAASHATKSWWTGLSR